MSYYILPKTNNIVDIDVTLTNRKLETYTSHSLFKYHKEIYSQLINICDFEDNTMDSLLKSVHPYEYIFSKVPGSKFSVSKLKTSSNTFYDVLEILNNSNIFDKYDDSIKSLYITHNFNDIKHCCELIRENNDDVVTIFESINKDLFQIINGKRFDFIFFEIEPIIFLDTNLYALKMLEILKIILKYQQSSGNIIIKIDNIFYKPIIDIIYIFTSIYEKTIVVKPSTSNITTFEKYIVCKNFIANERRNDIYKKIYFDIIKFMDCYSKTNYLNVNIESIINGDAPYYFLNKIDDINIINGQQQLESINQIINAIKNKNREEKFETIKKINIQKSVNWCEKFKIPFNKFSEKANVFLQTTPEDTDTQEPIDFS
jgi:hypothetical protein